VFWLMLFVYPLLAAVGVLGALAQNALAVGLVVGAVLIVAPLAWYRAPRPVTRRSGPLGLREIHGRPAGRRRWAGAGGRPVGRAARQGGKYATRPMGSRAARRETEGAATAQCAQWEEALP
jgi:hypothetical protein